MLRVSYMLFRENRGTEKREEKTRKSRAQRRVMRLPIDAESD